ncbi:hypothetical protein F5X68DRAFT_199929 [Plectosphaerella plurivora]|uniref:Uncharacterized protein n=1 Tax=Plectosphaerella plurivora TaxID=936078 RepID=A0A9P9AEZ3_9PEZI|nr:hypothetical protein F5X68DRAFT_199929 [Plectosphaerella plurivora]
MAITACTSLPTLLVSICASMLPRLLITTSITKLLLPPTPPFSRLRTTLRAITRWRPPRSSRARRPKPTWIGLIWGCTRYGAWRMARYAHAQEDGNGVGGIRLGLLFFSLCP